MFDLFRSRDKAVRILLGALLLLVALSMLTYLIPTYDTGSAGAAGTVVAQVGKETITLPDVQRLVQNNLRSRQLPAEILPNLVPQMVQDLITERAMAYEAERLGFRVSDAELSDTIRQTLPTLFPGGNFVGKEAYASMLAQENLSIPEFEADLRRQILVTRLRSIAIEGTIVSPAEIELAYRKKSQKTQFQWVKVTAERYKSELQASPAELQSYYNANKASYQTPERKDLTLLVGDQNKLAQAQTPSDAELRRQYEQNKDQYRIPERVDVRHILLKTTDKAPAEDAKIKAKAEDLAKQLKAGADFAKLAKQYSEDPGSSQTGGEYKGVTRGQMVPEFEQAAFSLKPGQISDPVKSAIGYHVIQVEKHEDARLRPFDEVKDEIAAQWKKQRASDLMQQIADKAQIELRKDPAHPETVAAQFQMQVVHAIAEAGKPIPEVGSSPDFDQAIAILKKGEVSQPVAVADSKIVLAVLNDVIPPKPYSFEEVQDKVRDAIISLRTRIVLQKHSQELFDKTKAMGGDLEKAAKEMGLQAKTSEPVDQNGTVEGLGSVAFMVDQFGRPAGTVFGPFMVPDGWMVGKIVQNTPVDLTKLAEERNSIRDEIKTQKARDRNTLFEAGLRDRLIKEGKIKIYQDVINRLVSDYQSNSRG